MSEYVGLRGLFASAALGALIFASAASAQDKQQSNADAGSLLSDVVVTATRQSDTVSRVALSIQAVTQKALDVQSIKSVNDLQRITPGLILTTSGGGTAGNTSDTNIAIRGVSSNQGAATTGVYLDEIPLQKRNLSGNGNGASYPKIFDLQRVEILRGPQGTLYGGSSEGGTVRFITPDPSFTHTSVFAKTDVSHTEGGDWSYEAGVAAGGPIVGDKLAFRASAWGRHLGGWIDKVSPWTGATLANNTNSGDDSAFKLTVAARPTERLTITPSLYLQNESRNDSDQFWENLAPFTVPAIISDAMGKNCTPTATKPCAYTVPAHTYAFNQFGPGKAGEVEVGGDGQEHADLAPQIRQLMVDSINFDYDLGFADVKFITSFIADEVKGNADNSFRATFPSNTGSISLNYLTPNWYNHQVYNQHREGVTEELRLASPSSNTSRFSYVIGAFYSALNTHSLQSTPAAFDEFAQVIRGVSATTLFGVPVLPGEQTGYNDQVFAERESAAYGEANYQLLEKLKFTVGLRVSRDKFTFRSTQYGPNNGYDVPTVANGGLVSGAVAETPVTPKVSLSYQVTDRDLVYATVSKGYREGGVNLGVPQVKCASDLTSLGIASTPITYNSDSVWSYETGAKLRLLDGAAQLNASAYYIDWSNLQSAVQLPTCTFGYTVNAGSAVSKGLDLEAQARAMGFTATLGLGYDDAYYTQALYTPANASGVKTLLINNGDRVLNTPKWTWTMGLQYDFNVMEKSTYLRADWQHQDPQYRSYGPGAATYTSDTYKSTVNNEVNMRLGATLNSSTDASLYMNNVANSTDELYRYGGHSGTKYNPLFFATTFRPREIGVTITYRH